MHTKLAAIGVATLSPRAFDGLMDAGIFTKSQVASARALARRWRPA
jgi:hypothetical protein